MIKNLLARVRIVLVEPAGALNVGSVARIMKNMGLSQLVLVKPHCDPLGEEAKRMAVHGRDILVASQQVASLPEALQGCQRAIATTARTRTLPTTLETPEIGLSWLLEANISSALIFGPEDRGLSNAELNYAQRFVTIPANPEYSSLNLAQAVTVCCYQLYQISLKSKIEQETTNSEISAASLDALEGYYEHLEKLLLKIGYLYPHTTTARMDKFRRLFNRANLTQEEVAMLRGILSQMEWALNQQSQL